MPSGEEFPPIWGKPIQCPEGFSTFDAIARAEALADELERLELEQSGLENDPSGHSPAEEKLATPPPAERLTKNQKKNVKDRLLRRSRRELNGSGPKGCSKKYREPARQHPLHVNASAATDLPHSKPAWIGVRELEEDWSVYGLDELQEKYGLRLVEWDGK